MITIEKKDVPLTLYGILAEKHDTSSNYIEKIVNGRRNPTRGKGAAILEDWRQIEENHCNWVLDYRSDKSVVVQMEDIKVCVFVQRGVASVYKRNECVREDSLDVETTSVNDFTKYLQNVRSAFK